MSTQKATGKEIRKDRHKLLSQRQAGKQKKYYEPVIFRAWCKSCGICSAFCPQHVIGLDDTGAPVVERPQDCNGCLFCEPHCPDFAITIKERKTETQRTSL